MPLLTELEFLFIARTTNMPAPLGLALRPRIPTGFRPKAQGCESRATLGHRPQDSSTATRLRQFHSPPRGHKLVEVVFVFGRLPKVAPTDRGNLGLKAATPLELSPRTSSRALITSSPIPRGRDALCLPEISAGRRSGFRQKAAIENFRPVCGPLLRRRYG